MVTADGGGSWRLAKPGAPVEALPAGSSPLWEPGWDGPERLLAVDPVAGTVAPFAHQPGLTMGVLVPGIAPSWGIWVRGVTAGRHSALAISRDGGRSWAVHEFPLDGDGPVASGDGRTIYAVLSPYQPGQATRPQVWVSRDAGATWQRAGGQLPTGYASGLAVLRGGALAVQFLAGLPVDGTTAVDSTGQGTQAVTYRSNDQGTHFSSGPTIPGQSVQVVASGGYLASDQPELPGALGLLGSGTTRAYWSADGVTWTPVRYPSPG